jgi:hypothetical protein
MSERTDPTRPAVDSGDEAGTSTTTSAPPPSPFPPRTPLGTIWYWAKRAWQLEVGVWKSLYRFVFRRPKVPPGATPITYHKSILTILMIFIVLSAVEIPIIDLITHRWPWVRIPLLAAGIWGLTWMVGYLFGFLTRPHSVGPDGILIREGADLEVVLPWADVYSVARDVEVAEPKSPKFTPGRTPGAWILHLRLQHETNIVIELERPITVRMPRGTVLLDEVRCYADDPRAFLEAARPHL